jgi:hypothetical protein
VIAGTLTAAARNLVTENYVDNACRLLREMVCVEDPKDAELSDLRSKVTSFQATVAKLPEERAALVTELEIWETARST